VDKIVGLELLHRHTHYSLLDGYATPDEYGAYSKQVNQKFLCISDHGMMAAVPAQIRACEQYGLEPIYACELYINPEQPEIPTGMTTGQFVSDWDEEVKKRLRKSYHLLAIAYNNEGYKNLIKLSSWGWTKGFYYKPRINYQILNEHKEGLIFTSCCYNSEIGQAFDRGGADEADAVVERYIAMFGKENFYLEVMLLDFAKQKPYNAYIMRAARKYGLKWIVTTDTHYCKPEDSEMQRKMLMVQTGRTLGDIAKAQAAEGELADAFELQDSNLWMKSEEEINAKWESGYSDMMEYDFLKEAKMNTVAICQRAKGVVLDRSIKLPRLENDDEKFLQAYMEGFEKRGLPKTREYLNRIKEEYSLIKEKEFSSYFLIQKMMSDEARRYWSAKHGGSGSDATGPGRGSAAGALACYCLGITDVNPIPHDLLFSRFLSPARGGKAMKLRFTIPPITNSTNI